jgi:hypothetical protein
MKIVLTMRPYSCRARVRRFLRGYDWSLPISSDAVTQPRFSDPATRRRSSQLRRMNRLSGWRYWKLTSRVVAAFRVSSRMYQFVHQAHEDDDRLGGGAPVIGAEAQEAERAELDGEPQAVGGRACSGDLPAIRTGVSEVGLDVAGDYLRGKAVEPLAFRVAEEPDGHGGLLRGTAVPRFSQTKVSEKAPMIRSRPRQIRAFRFSKTILGMDFSELYDYDGFRESRKERPHADRLCPGFH